ncbi:MAG: hypothetical protein AAGD04_07500 [Pseudomonadota bacterium]
MPYLILTFVCLGLSALYLYKSINDCRVATLYFLFALAYAVAGQSYFALYVDKASSAQHNPHYHAHQPKNADPEGAKVQWHDFLKPGAQGFIFEASFAGSGDLDD